MNILQPSQQVNRIGKFLYKHLDGAYKIEKSSNSCDIYLTVLYQIPPALLKKYGIEEEKYTEVHEMTVNLSITTYSNKVRINIIAMNPEEKTIGFDLYTSEELMDMNKAFHKIYNKVCKRLSKEFEDYEFLF